MLRSRHNSPSVRQAKAMPELPGTCGRRIAEDDRCSPRSEVERARKLIADSCTGYRIASVETAEDKIVYTGGTVHTDFVSFQSIRARRLLLTSSGERARRTHDHRMRAERQTVGDDESALTVRSS